MSQQFQRVGIIGKANHPATHVTLQDLQKFLLAHDARFQVVIETQTAKQLVTPPYRTLDLPDFKQHIDLAIVVGGDGNMLGAARLLAQAQVPVIGVNRGKLGFLTDLNPDCFQERLNDVLMGNYLQEERFLLEVHRIQQQQIKSSHVAVNEIVIHSNKVAHMIEFDTFINDEFAFSQNADGLIISSPTGSTAYSLSGGGPIVHPGLQAFVLCPMYPHSLSTRPLVVGSDSVIKINTQPDANAIIQISCDSHIAIDVEPSDSIIIKKSTHYLTLLHPKDHSYYRILRSKLGWGKKLT